MRTHISMSFCLALGISALMIAVPTGANAAWSWWSGWDTFDECVVYMREHQYRHYTAEESCLSTKMAEDERNKKKADLNRMIILGCRAESASNAQYAACVELALSTGK